MQDLELLYDGVEDLVNIMESIWNQDAKEFKKNTSGNSIIKLQKRINIPGVNQGNLSNLFDKILSEQFTKEEIDRINKMIEQDNYSYLVLFEINKELFSLRSYLIEIYNQNIDLNINKVIRTSLIDIDLSVSLIEKLQ